MSPRIASSPSPDTDLDSNPGNSHNKEGSLNKGSQSQRESPNAGEPMGPPSSRTPSAHRTGSPSRSPGQSGTPGATSEQALSNQAQKEAIRVWNLTNTTGSRTPTTRTPNTHRPAPGGSTGSPGQGGNPLLTPELAKAHQDALHIGRLAAYKASLNAVNHATLNANTARYR